MILLKLYLKHELESFIIDIESNLGKGTVKLKLLENFDIKFSDIILDMNVNAIKKDPIGYAKSCSQAELEELVAKLNDSYYNKTSLVSDEIYDMLTEYIKDNFESNILDNIGADIDVSKEKVPLPTHLPSMDKIRPDTNALPNWLADYPGNKVTSDKLDGMSLLVDARQKPIKAYTRGNGDIGQDISWIANYINLGTINNGMVRGECVVSKENWGKLKKKYPEYSNARNFVSGYTGRKSVSESMMKYIDFVAYEWITDVPLNIETQLKTLTNFGMTVVDYNVFDTVTNAQLSTMLESRRDTGKYEVDGIIVTDNQPHPRETEKKYPKYARAFKMVLDDQTAEVFVEGITWEPSMYGTLNPVVNVSTVNLDGANISNASGYNANFITNNDIGGIIGPGAVVKLTRSGGVIPKILKVIKPYSGSKTDVLPAQQDYEGGYGWTDTSVDIVLNQPDKNDTVRLKRIEHFFGTLGVPYFRSGMINKVYDAGYNTIPIILKMTAADLLKLDGIKEKSANKIVTAISKYYKKAKLLDIMAACYAFGSGYGRRKIKPILNKHPNILDLDISVPLINEKLLNSIIEIDGYQEKTASKFLEGLPEFKTFYSNLPSINADVHEQEEETKVVGDKFLGKIFSSTGFRPDKSLTKIIESNGGKIESSVKSNVTDLLVKKKTDKLSGKVLKAKEKGINIIFLDDFMATL